MLTVHRRKYVVGANALANAAAITGDYVSLKNAGHVTVIVTVTPASGTDTLAITMKQATDVGNSLSDEKALAFTRYWKATYTSTDVLTETTASSSITTSNAAAAQVFILEFDASELDVANGFDCIRADLTDPGSVSTPAHVLYILDDIRTGNPAGTSFIVD